MGTRLINENQKQGTGNSRPLPHDLSTPSELNIHVRDRHKGYFEPDPEFPSGSRKKSRRKVDEGRKKKLGTNARLKSPPRSAPVLLARNAQMEMTRWLEKSERKKRMNGGK